MRRWRTPCCQSVLQLAKLSHPVYTHKRNEIDVALHVWRIKWHLSFQVEFVSWWLQTWHLEGWTSMTSHMSTTMTSRETSRSTCTVWAALAEQGKRRSVCINMRLLFNSAAAFYCCLEQRVHIISARKKSAHTRITVINSQ